MKLEVSMNDESFTHQYEKIKSKLNQELELAERLQLTVQEHDNRRSSRQSARFKAIVEHHRRQVEAIQAELNEISSKPDLEALCREILSIQNQYDQIKQQRKAYEEKLKHLKTPKFFERLFANHILRPMMAVFLVSSSMMAYTSLVEVTNGGLFVLILASAQALFYFSAERDTNYEYLATLGASIDDFFLYFSLGMKQFYLLLMGLAWLASGFAFAALAITLLPPIALIVTWPIAYQFALLMGIGLFLMKIFFELVQDMYGIVTNDRYKQRSLLGKLTPALIYGPFLLLVAIAHTVEQLAMLAMLINVGTTAQLFLVFYGTWFFLTRQVSYQDKVAQYTDQLDHLNWDNLIKQRWKILEFFLFMTTTIGLAALIVFPPTWIAPMIAKLDLSTVPETLRLLISVGIASVASLTFISLCATIGDLLWGDYSDSEHEFESGDHPLPTPCYIQSKYVLSSRKDTELNDRLTSADQPLDADQPLPSLKCTLG